IGALHAQQAHADIGRTEGLPVEDPNGDPLGPASVEPAQQKKDPWRPAGGPFLQIARRLLAANGAQRCYTVVHPH
ncbi:MAG: hypothetical protein ABIN41_04375, partial [Devosia sp.]